MNILTFWLKTRWKTQTFEPQQERIYLIFSSYHVDEDICNLHREKLQVDLFMHCLFYLQAYQFISCFKTTKQ